MEIAVTGRFALCLYARPEEDVLGAALYRGDGQRQTLSRLLSYDSSALSFKEEMRLAAHFAMPAVSGAGIADRMQ